MQMNFLVKYNRLLMLLKGDMAYTRFSFSNNLEKSLMPEFPMTPPIILNLPPERSTQGKKIETIPLEQLLQRSLKLFIDTKAGNTPQDLLYEIRQIFFSLY